MVGTWKIEVNVGGMPQKVASAFTDFSDKILGAEYTPIAYLGSQLVNGINHAVLAEQLLTVGRDVKNVVIVFFNEKEDKVTMCGIERVLEMGDPMGGIKVDVLTPIPVDERKLFDETFEGFVGSKVEPFAYLGSQVVKGKNHFYAATVTPVVENPTPAVVIITINDMTKDVSFFDVLSSKGEIASLGYAFTWLKNTSFGKPLGEWP